jgi:hypothetical protein
MGPFLFFGDVPGARLPSLKKMKTARHNKANSTGKKSERPNIKEIPKGQFDSFSNIESLYVILFGGAPAKPKSKT